MKELELKEVLPTELTGIVVFHVIAGGSKIEIYDNPQGTGSPISLPAYYSTPSDLPTTLNVKGIVASDEPNDVILQYIDTTTGFSDVIKLTVVEVASLTAPGATTIDDEDGNDDTITQIISVWDLPPGIPVVDVDVFATPNPEGISSLPSSWSLVGGEGTHPQHRTIDRESPSKTVITCTCGTSTKTLTVYVYEAKLGLYADEGDGLWPPYQPDVWGHSWWSLSIDGNCTEIFDLAAYHNLELYLDIGGWWPDNEEVQGSWPFPSGLGQLILGDQGHNWTGKSEWIIDFPSLVTALSYVKYIDDEENEVQWQATGENCTDMAIWVGETAGVETLDSSGIDTPAAFADYLKNDEN
jgi:hypothetical protein